MARWAEVAELYDERFCRMWEYYLSTAEAAFRYEDLVVFQIQMSKRSDVVPVTRNYIARNEAQSILESDIERSVEGEADDVLVGRADL
jgi:cyclopropane-fatty-acyl-phospholipid synthase